MSSKIRWWGKIGSEIFRHPAVTLNPFLFVFVAVLIASPMYMLAHKGSPRMSIP